MIVIGTFVYVVQLNCGTRFEKMRKQKICKKKYFEPLIVFTS